MKKKILCGSLILILILSLLSGCQMQEAENPYALAENWAYAQREDTGKRADLFFLCPTVYSDGFNMPLDDAAGRESFLGATNMELGIYEKECRVFAPYYEQAGLDVYSAAPDEREPYLILAYESAADAFRYYMEHENNGRPFILAGFSQGADMCIRLLEEFGADQAVQDRMVACYAIGWRVTEADRKAWPHLKMAEREDDTGVIVSFNTEAESIDGSFAIPNGTRALSINPLNWKTDSTPADKTLNLGACFTDYSGSIVNEIPHLTGAYIDPERGALKVPDVSPEDYPAGLDFCQPGVYHIYDYLFFFRNLQENVSARVDAFLKNRN